MLLVLTLVGAAWLLAHFALLMRTLRAPRLAFWQRLLALLPPATPIIGWRAGIRGPTALWTFLGLTYGLLLRLS
jgi:hypothetical protein